MIIPNSSESDINETHFIEKKVIFAPVTRNGSNLTNKKKMSSKKKTINSEVIRLMIEIIKRHPIKKKSSDSYIARILDVTSPTIKALADGQEKVNIDTFEKAKTLFTDAYKLALEEQKVGMLELFSNLPQKMSTSNSVAIKKIIIKLYGTEKPWRDSGSKYASGNEYYQDKLGYKSNAAQRFGNMITPDRMEKQFQKNSVMDLYQANPELALAIRPIIISEKQKQGMALMSDPEKLDFIYEKIVLE